MANNNPVKQVLSNQNIVSSEEIYDIIYTNAKLLIDNPKLAHKIPPIMLRGAPGVGKSTIVNSVADALGIKFLDVRLAQREPVDLRGLPVPNKEEKSVEWYVTSDLPRDKNSKGILLFDELTSADRSLQVASYEIILDRRLGNLYSLPDGWYIVACGNRAEDRAVSTTMSSALANRFMHFDLAADSEKWCLWGVKNEIDPSVVGFISGNPGMICDMDGQNLERGWPSPRSWERVSNMIPIYKDNLSILAKVVYGLVGTGAGGAFMEFYKTNESFTNVLEIMHNPKLKIEIPTKSDKIWALCAAMQYLVWKGEDEEEEKRRLDGFMRIAIELPSDFSCVAFMGALQGNMTVAKDVACQKLASHPLFSKWSELHNKAFDKKYSLKI